MAGNLVLSLLLKADATLFREGIRKARSELDTLVAGAEVNGGRLKKALGDVGGNLRNLGTTLTAGITTPIANAGRRVVTV